MEIMVGSCLYSVGEPAHTSRATSFSLEDADGDGKGHFV